ncbi:aromatase/cyclase [Streptomyces sp. ICBB 8177]|uniref:aromatase/cyclase n=1 Tax=Streptomyces sp. ICBB 8177 TaxID=563922 RepID=UPI000D674378|nr:aromatase/cyclase [Streptomyces sp. ICBB 8177]PWI45363.1 cyclase [Streptomyces sp. ICBB 8177]
MTVTEQRLTTHETTHAIDVAAPARVVYGIIADVETWPQHFKPNVHVERLEEEAGLERIRIWATANGEVKTWSSVRTLDPEARRVTFRQDVSTPPVAAMGGEWIVTATGEDTSRLQLKHDFQAIDDDPANVEWINKALDENSGKELAGIKEVAELADRLGELVFSFTDTVHVEGDGADVFDFLNRSDLWPERLPHVAKLDLTEDTPGLQVMRMDTSTKDGSVHTTESVRVCFAPGRIVYKQTTVPLLMTAHTGEWLITPSGTGVDVSSTHTVTLRTDTIERILGEGKTTADARAYVHKALSTNSGVTLQHAKAYAEGRRG